MAIYAGLMASWSAAGSAQQMLPPSGSGIGPPPLFGVTRALPQAQSIAPAYAPQASPAMPIPPLISAPAAMPIPALGATGSQPLSLALVARFGRDAATQISTGLVWRVFPARPDVTGTFRAIKEDKTASPVMALPSGDYVVHVSFGLATTAQALHLKEATREVFDIPAVRVKL